MKLRNLAERFLRYVIEVELLIYTILPILLFIIVMIYGETSVQHTFSLVVSAIAVALMIIALANIEE